MKTYNKMKTTIINANAHLVCDPDNFYQYCEKSYPGYNVYASGECDELNGGRKKKREKRKSQ